MWTITTGESHSPCWLIQDPLFVGNLFVPSKLSAWIQSRTWFCILLATKIVQTIWNLNTAMTNFMWPIRILAGLIWRKAQDRPVSNFGFHLQTMMNTTQAFAPTCLGMTNPKLLNGGSKCTRSVSPATLWCCHKTTKNVWRLIQLWITLLWNHHQVLRGFVTQHINWFNSYYRQHFWFC